MQPRRASALVNTDTVLLIDEFPKSKSGDFARGTDFTDFANTMYGLQSGIVAATFSVAESDELLDACRRPLGREVAGHERALLGDLRVAGRGGGDSGEGRCRSRHHAGNDHEPERAERAHDHRRTVVRRSP